MPILTAFALSVSAPDKPLDGKRIAILATDGFEQVELTKPRQSLVANPYALRLERDAILFVKGFVDGGKPIAALCHGPWTLSGAGGVRGKNLTSWPSLKVDLGNAGAHWLDQAVVVDGRLVTSRKPDDIPAFNKEMIADFAGGSVAHAER